MIKFFSKPLGKERELEDDINMFFEKKSLHVAEYTAEVTILETHIFVVISY